MRLRNETKHKAVLHEALIIFILSKINIPLQVKQAN
jgi:hypothetical protein